MTPTPDLPPPAPAAPIAAAPRTLAQECGLAWPRPTLATWPPDRHLALALLAAVPVWLALG